MVTARGVRTTMRLDVRLPLLDAASQARVIRNIQILATADVRRTIAKPVRPTIPISTKNLRKSYKVRRPRKTRSRAYFTLMLYKFNYYYYFQEGSWEGFRERIFRQSDEILQTAMLAALRLEGME